MWDSIENKKNLLITYIALHHLSYRINPDLRYFHICHYNTRINACSNLKMNNKAHFQFAYHSHEVMEYSPQNFIGTIIA
jgi:hypothetical protein